jgi:hypothetical protein
LFRNSQFTEDAIMAKKKSAKKTTKKDITPALAEEMAKQAAKKRTITIELSRTQHAALSKQWSKLKPTEAAELVFTDGKSPTSLIKVAGYSYHGNTCCV